MRTSRRLSLSLALLMATSMSVVIGQGGPANAEPSHIKSLEANKYPDWMAQVPEHTSLAELSVPGTHDTLAVYGGDAVETQENHEQNGQPGGKSLAFQLGAGIRAIDIRVRIVPDENDNAKFAVHHGAQYLHANFDDVIREMSTFLAAHPSETILLNVKAECDESTFSCVDDDPTDPGELIFPGAGLPPIMVPSFTNEMKQQRRREVLDDYLHAHTSLFWQPSAFGEAAVPTLSAVRGKVVLVNFAGVGGGNYGGKGLEQLNYERWPADDGQPNCYVQNDYGLDTIGQIPMKRNLVKWQLERTNQTADCRDANQPNAGKMYYNWTNGSSAGAWPITVAAGWSLELGVNEFVLRCLTGQNNTCDTPAIKRTGVMMMDFPGRAIVDEIIERNPRGLDHSTNGGVGEPREEHPGGDDGGPRPGVPADHSACRPDGMVRTAGVAAQYCKVYQGDGREWLGQGRTRRVVGYFSSWRTGGNGPRYLVPNIPWSKLTHINYAFANVQNNQISVGANDASNPATGMEWPGVAGAEMDPEFTFKGHFNLLAKYKKLHPRVKTLISVGGWAETGGFYAMTTNADGSVNQAGINTFADSAVDFLRTYRFDGVDIDFEYPTSLADGGNPNDWGTAAPRRAGLPNAYAALMKTLREKLDQAGAGDDRYYLLTSAASASGYVVRGMENQKALRYQDFTNLMAYDFHGTWNNVVGPNAPLYDDGNDPELSDLYNTPEYQQIGYFNTDWAFNYLRGAMQAGRINIGVPYYTRGWTGVTGGNHGMWGTSVSSEPCEPGTGISRPCGEGAKGIDNIWHDVDGPGNELGAGFNPMWHAKNLERNIRPAYAPNVGLSPTDPDDQLTGTYTRHWDETTRTSWLWNQAKQTFLSTEDHQGLDAITGYVKDKGAGGVMMWELAGDYECPWNVTASTPCGMGYTMTDRLHTGLADAGGYGDSRSAGSSVTPPSSTLNVRVDLVNYPGDAASLWPLTPVVRITNQMSSHLGGPADTEISFDLPTSTPALVKDGDWQTYAQGGRWRVQAGHTGSNVGGLSGPFHRVILKLDYCQLIPPGQSLDVPIIYYLPATGPVNTVIRSGGASYSLASENARGASASGGPATAGCIAPAWNAATIYNPETQTVQQTTVTYNGKIWKAKWWTQGNAPGTGTDPDNEPWKLVGPAS
ncbi:phosphatidylinositol-specific phospholipase C domain-containing protein [Sphaerisporangium aureirubrum]|uniref:1-phosphatidylinositol phosphodiesterase n=1 Tax=Sphaerisporangium aureirubrum TaxID=1544736 RepID=A0ABW1NI51_9ACTN